MAESRVPVDLMHPGQVFACIGILELADTLLGDAQGAFDWSEPEQKFYVSASGEEKPAERVARFLEEAEVVSLAPPGSRTLGKWTQKWGNEPEVIAPDRPFPFPDPESPATLPAILRDGEGNEVAIDHWGDATRRDNVKFWAGAGGYPGSALLRDALDAVRGKIGQHANNPFALSEAQSSSFRLDWRRDYIPVQDGFSPNKHGSITMVGFPLVEVLAAIGLTNARPNRRQKLEYTYGVLGGGRYQPLDPILIRAALGADASPVPGHPFRRFAMKLDWPGQEGQARCISQITEEDI